jgi:hypothetical protein
MDNNGRGYVRHRRNVIATSIRRGLGVRVRGNDQGLPVLDPLTNSLINHVALGQAKLDKYERDGQEDSKHYWTAYNAVYRARRDLERRLKEVGLISEKPLRRTSYLDQFREGES